jgi:hypothetical protein
MEKGSKKKIDEILSALELRGGLPASIKNNRGIYTYANEGWSELAATPIQKITSSRDDQLPWGPMNTQFILFMDKLARQQGGFKSIDRRPHFQQKRWMCSSIEKIHLPEDGIIVTVVEPVLTDEFSRIASQVTEQGLVHNDHSLSVKQLYLLHQLLFQVPHKVTARELGCSENRIHQCLRDLREEFDADDSKELICALSANGLFPLLEHFDLLFKHHFLTTEMKRH